MSDNLTARIEQLAPELEKIISTSEPIEHLADGFGGAQGPAEGPLWWEESGYLLFSDIHNDRRMKYQPGSGVSLFLEPTNRANGLTRDPMGRLVACEHDSRRVTRQEADGSITVVANGFQGRRLTGLTTLSSAPTAASISATRGAARPRPSSGTCNIPGSTESPPTWAR